MFKAPQLGEEVIGTGHGGVEAASLGWPGGNKALEALLNSSDMIVNLLAKALELVIDASHDLQCGIGQVCKGQCSVGVTKALIERFYLLRGD